MAIRQVTWTRESEDAALKTLKGKTILGYVRQSKSDLNPDGSVKGYSLQQQRAVIARYPEFSGCTFEFFEDANVSGSRPFERRPAGKAMLDRINNSRGEVGAVAVYTGDRLARNTVEALNFKGILEQHQILLFYVDTGLQRQESKFAFTVLAAAAEEERRKIAQKAKDNKAFAKRQGIALGKAPAGYKRVNGPDGKKMMVIDEATAPLVRDLFKRYASGKYSTAGLCNYLKQNGIESPTGTLNPSSFREMLKSPLYIGKVYEGLEGESRLIAAKHPALIDQKTFDQVQQVMRENTRLGGSRTHYRFPLAGVLYCGVCGGPMHGEGARQIKVKDESGRWHVVTYAYYKCRTKRQWKDGVKKPCGNKSVPVDVLESAIRDRLHEISEPTRAKYDAEFKARLATLVKGGESKRSIAAQNKRLDEEAERVEYVYIKQRKTKEWLERELARIDALRPDASVPTDKTEYTKFLDYARRQVFDLVKAWDETAQPEAANVVKPSKGSSPAIVGESHEAQARMLKAVFSRIDVTYGGKAKRSKGNGISLTLTPNPEFRAYFEDVLRPFLAKVESDYLDREHHAKVLALPKVGKASTRKVTDIRFTYAV